jgi:hypothetical protein
MLGSSQGPIFIFKNCGVPCGFERRDVFDVAGRAQAVRI